MSNMPLVPVCPSTSEFCAVIIWSSVQNKTTKGQVIKRRTERGLRVNAVPTSDIRHKKVYMYVRVLPRLLLNTKDDQIRAKHELKNPAYGRQQHSRPMRIVGPIQI